MSTDPHTRYELIERNQELLAENRILRDELARLQRHNSILEQRLRRIGDAVVEGRTVDGQ